MDTRKDCHGYGGDMDFTHKKSSVRDNTKQIHCRCCSILGIVGLAVRIAHIQFRSGLDQVKSSLIHLSFTPTSQCTLASKNKG